MPRYRSKVVEIEAILWTGHNIDEIMEFVFQDERRTDVDSEYINPGIGHIPPLGTLNIPTLEGTMTANAGDFIIRGLKGELYPCKPDIFEMKYEMLCRYLSTYCIHNLHETCRLFCKICENPCVCNCHRVG